MKVTLTTGAVITGRQVKAPDGYICLKHKDITHYIPCERTKGVKK